MPVFHTQAEPTWDELTVGGGAEIEGAGNPGALLIGSRPAFFEDDDDEVGSEFPIGWEAWSSDHIREYRHRVRAYVIGLRLSGLSRQQLLENIQVKAKSSYALPRQAHPAVTADLDPGYILIGGGAFTQSFEQFLVYSYGYGGSNAWHAKSKDHLVSAPGFIRAYAIGIRMCPIGYAGCLEGSTSFTSTSISTGYGSASATTHSAFVVTGVGRFSQYGGLGRMLTDLIPVTQISGNPQQGALVSSKDHEGVDGGTTYAFALRLRKKP